MTAWPTRRLFPLVLILGASLGAPPPGPLMAQEGTRSPDAIAQSFGSWILRCGAEGAGCHVFQELLRTEDRARLLRVTLMPGADEARLMRVLTPLGPDLASGVQLAVDGEARVTLPFVTCWQRGCVAEALVTSELEVALLGGETLSVAIVGADTGQTVRIELALEGLDRALDGLAEMR